MQIPVVPQLRHVHLSQEDARVLFGDQPLEVMDETGHRGQVVYKQTVRIVGPGGSYDRVRIIGPYRAQSQAELSPTDAHALGMNAPVRLSGDLAHAAKCELVGPCGSVSRSGLAIIPAPHLHCAPAVASELGVRHYQIVHMRSATRPEIEIRHVTVRVHPTFQTELHITTDEAAEHWIDPLHSVEFL